MFRIIQFAIPYEDFIKKAGDGANRSTVEGIQENCKLDRDGDKWVSEPIATTSARFFVVEQYLRSLYGDPPHLIKDVTAKYKLLRTRAPVAYDYGYVVEIGTMPGEFGEERMVAIPKESVEYQSGRYCSGMFTPIDCS